MEHEKGSKNEVWNDRNKELVVERTEILSPNLENVSISFAQGQLLIEGDEQLQSPVLTTRLTIKAESELKARNFLQESGDRLLQIESDNGSLDIRGMTSHGTTIINGGRGGGLYVGDNIFVGGNINTGNIIINGISISSSGREAKILPGASLEAVLKVPTTKGIRYELSNKAGETEITNTRGEINYNTAAGQLTISDHGGRATIHSASGDVTLSRIQGEVNASTASGDVRINQIKGEIQLQTASGDVSVSQAELAGRNNSVRTASGDQRIGLSNSSVTVRAEGMGSIRTDRKYIIDKDDRKKGGKSSGSISIDGDFVGGNVVSIGRGNIVVSSGGIYIGGSRGGQSSVEAHIGADSRSSNSIRLVAASGDITLE